jgi:hypothetical protein
MKVGVVGRGGRTQGYGVASPHIATGSPGKLRMTGAASRDDRGRESKQTLPSALIAPHTSYTTHMKRALFLVFFSLLALSFAPAPAQAQTAKNKGLLISPLREYVDVAAGASRAKTFTVANLTENPISVNFSVQAFSVSDYAYDYRFSDPPNDWVRLSVATLELRPGENRKIPYVVSVPADSPAGGQYYTLFASASLSDKGIASTVRAATLLYVTVEGELRRTSQLVSSSLPRFAYGTEIPYTLDVKNTGNTHFFANFSGKLQGLSAKPETTGTSHLLLPGKIRRISGAIPAPLLPGLYKATYGYTTDVGEKVAQTRFVVFVPPWSVALVVLLALLASILLQRKKPRLPPPQDEPNGDQAAGSKS